MTELQKKVLDVMQTSDRAVLTSAEIGELVRKKYPCTAPTIAAAGCALAPLYRKGGPPTIRRKNLPTKELTTVLVPKYGKFPQSLVRVFTKKTHWWLAGRKEADEEIRARYAAAQKKVKEGGLSE